MNRKVEMELAKMAMEMGIITREQFASALEKSKKGASDLPLSQLMVHMGLLTAAQAQHLRRQLAMTRKNRIDQYDLLEKLGEGGMGVVYKALHRPTGEVRALKVLHSRVATDEEIVERFYREAKSYSLLEAPQVVKCYEVKKWKKTFFMAMEFIEGENLYERLLKQGKLSEKEALEIARSVAQALDMAHKQGIIHRDIKPENILIDHLGTVKLADFGLARVDREGEMHLTQTGVFIGTPSYISPEQARGEKGIDIRSDIYSLGITLFHMVTGRLPFEDKSALVVCQKHIVEPLPNPLKYNQNISLGLARLVRKMAAKEPPKRPQDPQKVLEMIDRIRTGDSTIIARDKSMFKSIVQPRSSSKIKWILLFPLVLIMGFLAGLFFDLGSRDELDLNQKHNQSQPSSEHPHSKWTAKIDSHLEKGDLNGAYRTLVSKKEDFSEGSPLYSEMQQKVKDKVESAFRDWKEKIFKNLIQKEGFFFAPRDLRRAINELTDEFHALPLKGFLSPLSTMGGKIIDDLENYNIWLREGHYKKIYHKLEWLLPASEEKMALLETCKALVRLQKKMDKYLTNPSNFIKPFEVRVKNLQRLTSRGRECLAAWKQFLKAVRLFEGTNDHFFLREWENWPWLKKWKEKSRNLKFLKVRGWPKERRALALLLEGEYLRYQGRLPQGVEKLKEWKENHSSTLVFRRSLQGTEVRLAIYILLVRHQKKMADYLDDSLSEKVTFTKEDGEKLEAYNQKLRKKQFEMRRKNEAFLHNLVHLARWQSFLLRQTQGPWRFFTVIEKVEKRVPALLEKPERFLYFYRFLRRNTSTLRKFLLGEEGRIPRGFDSLIEDLWHFVTFSRLLNRYYPRFCKKVAAKEKAPASSLLAQIGRSLKILAWGLRKKGAFDYGFLSHYFSFLLEELTRKVAQDLPPAEGEILLKEEFKLPQDLSDFHLKQSDFRTVRKDSPRELYGRLEEFLSPLRLPYWGSPKKVVFEGYLLPRGSLLINFEGREGEKRALKIHVNRQEKLTVFYQKDFSQRKDGLLLPGEKSKIYVKSSHKGKVSLVFKRVEKEWNIILNGKVIQNLSSGDIFRLQGEFDICFGGMTLNKVQLESQVDRITFSKVIQDLQEIFSRANRKGR